MNKLLASLVAVIVTCLFALPVVAQTIELTETQLKNNEEAIKHLTDGNLEAARSKLELSLRIGEANIIYLNLGRTLQKMGDCMGARENFQKARTAPKVQRPTTAEIEAVLSSYESELPEVCPGRLTVTCSPQSMQVLLNGETAMVCGEEMEIAPGSHNLIGRVDDVVDEKTVEVAEGQAVAVSLTVSVPVKDESVPPVVVQPDSGSTRMTLGWVALGTGVALIGVASVFDNVLMQTQLEAAEAAVSDANAAQNATEYNQARSDYAEARDEFDSLKTPTLVLFGVGTAALVTGVVLLVWPDSEESSVSVSPTPDGVSVGYSTHF